MFERTIISTFGSCGEKTGRQFPALDVIGKAITANALARAGFIAAIAFVAIAILLALHYYPSSGIVE